MQNISHCYQQGDADVLCQWFPRAPETAQLCDSKEQKLRLSKKKAPQKAPPETLLKLPHFYQTAVQSLPSALLRKGPDEGTAPDYFCRISVWHTAGCLDPLGLVWQVMEMLQIPFSELLRCHFLEQAAVAHKLILLILLPVTMW